MIMDDSTPMPFGTHKGKPMEDVPARYLLWLWEDSIWNEPERPLHHYIKTSFSALEQECKDFIITHRPK